MASNINPSLTPVNSLDNFRFWCQKVLPLVYDDSLSYYEVLGKMVVQLNDVIDNVNADTENVLTLKDAFLELQTYVNNFFDDIEQLASYAERAEAAQTAANTSAVNAATSASNASQSSLAAMDARDTAVAARQAAQASANTASTAATNANTKANEAAQSAITAQTAQVSASQSATLAATDRSAAQTAASTATNKANEANTSATNAEASAENAAQSEANAEELVNNIRENLNNIQQNTQDIRDLKESLTQVENATIVEIKSKNYFNVDEMDFGLGLNGTTGAITTYPNPSSNSYPVSPFYDISDKSGYVVSSGRYNEKRTSRNMTICFYNTSKTFISGASNKSSVAIPENSAYMVFSLNKAFWNADAYNFDVQVEITDNGIATPYEAYFPPYYENSLTPQVAQNTADINDNRIWESVLTASNNLIAGRIKWATGEIEVNGTNFYHVAIEGTEGDTVYFYSCIAGNGSNYGYAFYDENGDYISGVPITQEEDIAAVFPHNAVLFKYGMYYQNWTQEKYNTIKFIQASKETILKTILNTELTNYKWNDVGDSVTYNGLYSAIVADELNLVCINCGVASSTIAINNTELTNQSIVERVCGLNGNTQYTDADVWTIFGGLNDVLYSSTLGSLASTGTTFDNSTVYGALQSICENIMNRRAHPRLILVTPTHTVRDSFSKATSGITIEEIRQAMIDVGEYYGVPVIDMWALGGINAFNMQKQTNPTTSDGVHPNKVGAELMAMPITNTIRDMFYDVK